MRALFLTTVRANIVHWHSAFCLRDQERQVNEGECSSWHVVLMLLPVVRCIVVPTVEGDECIGPAGGYVSSAKKRAVGGDTKGWLRNQAAV